MANMMTTIDKSYNAFEKDIAIVNVASGKDGSSIEQISSRK
jgi:hypothetical protein